MITLAQLYNLGLTENIDIFSGLQLPADSPMSRNIMVNCIMERCGLNIPLYADVPVMRSAIQVWSAKHQYTFKHIAKIYEASYSPIENTDRYEDITVTRDRDLTDKKTDKNKVTSSGREDLNTESSTDVTEGKTSTHSGTDTNTEEVTTSAYNASTYQPDTKTTNSLLHGESITDTGSGSTDSTGSSTKSTSSDKTIDNSSDQTVAEDETTRTINHTHGNIGVMDNATMQEKEYELLNGFNPYTFISELFENELTVFVY